MARIRTIKPEFFRHHQLYLLETETKLPLRIAFAGLWTAADREGRFRWIPENLKLDCLPYDKVDFSRVLDALATRGFIEKYTSNGKDYGWIPGFLTHQVINNRERPSNLPNPFDSSVSTRAPRVMDACPTPLNLDQGEGKGKEQGKEGDNDASMTRGICAFGNRCNGKQKDCSEAFEKFWSVYPQHAPSQKETKKAWCIAFRNGIDLLAMLSWIAKANKAWTDKKFIPYAPTFLNQRRWEGDLPISQTNSHETPIEKLAREKREKLDAMQKNA